MSSEEMMSIFWRLLAVGVLVLLNGFFVAAEFALVKIRDTQLQPFLRRGSKRARLAMTVLKDLDRSLSAAQLGITLASLALGWIGEPVFARLLKPLLAALHISNPNIEHSITVVIGFTLITFLHIVVGEQAPKWMAIQKPLPTSLWVAAPLRLFYVVTYPFIWVLNGASLWFLRQIGIEASGEGEHGHSQDELRLLVATSQSHETSSPPGRNLVLNAFDLKHRVAREVMRPRQQIVGFDTEASLAECLEQAEKSRFSRFPIFERGNPDRALGVIHIKDLYSVRSKAQFARDLLPLSKKIIYVPETSRLERLLHLFLDRKVHLALVVDEYGGTVGLVTLENILEELVGQIQDEFDQEKPLLVRQDEHTWIVDGALPIHELAEVIGEPLFEEGVTTANGLITQRLGGFPRVGDAVALGIYELKVEQMDGPRVVQLSMRRPAGGNSAP